MNDKNKIGDKAESCSILTSILKNRKEKLFYKY